MAKFVADHHHVVVACDFLARQETASLNRVCPDQREEVWRSAGDGARDGLAVTTTLTVSDWAIAVSANKPFSPRYAAACAAADIGVKRLFFVWAPRITKSRGKCAAAKKTNTDGAVNRGRGADPQSQRDDGDSRKPLGPRERAEHVLEVGQHAGSGESAMPVRLLPEGNRQRGAVTRPKPGPNCSAKSGGSGPRARGAARGSFGADADSRRRLQRTARNVTVKSRDSVGARPPARSDLDAWQMPTPTPLERTLGWQRSKPDPLGFPLDPFGFPLDPFGLPLSVRGSCARGGWLLVTLLARRSGASMTSGLSKLIETSRLRLVLSSKRSMPRPISKAN